MKKIKFGQIGKLKKEFIEEYKKLHMIDIYTEKWAGVLEKIKECNIRNYSIFIEDDLVFAYFEYIGNNYEEDMKKMSLDNLTQEWWTFTHPCFAKYSDTSKDLFYNDMQQIFSFEG